MPKLVNRWKVPAMDPDYECEVSWSEDFGGYVLDTRSPEGRFYRYPGDRLRGTLLEQDAQRRDHAMPTLHALMVATFAGVCWSDVPASVLAEMKEAPTLAYLEAKHATPREIAVADALRLSLVD